VESIWQRWEAGKARREEREALLLFGASLPPSPEVAVIDEKIAAFTRTLAVSLARDRADYAAVAPWARPLVVLRGVLDRAVLRALRRRAATGRREACVRLGEASLESAQGALALAAREARKRAQDAAAQLKPLPLAAREAQHLGRFLWKETRLQIFPRMPGLVGLLVGFWIAQTFTDSEFSATLHSWGIGRGPRRAVRGETLRAMNVVLPLLAAAVASYAGSRFAALIKSRYSPATSSQHPAAGTQRPVKD
jgi:hypothetical protein